MEKDRSRAQRRYQHAIVKRNRRNYMRIREIVTPRNLGITVHTPKLCSCVMCGNPRKWLKEFTLDEKKHLHLFHEGLQELE